MAKQTQKQGEQEAIEAKEIKRQIALKNLSAESLKNLALAYFINKGKDFGENDNAVVEQFKYMPAINGSTEFYNDQGQKSNILLDSLLGSRVERERYSGNVSEHKIIKDAATIIQQSLIGIKVGDALKLMGSNPNIAGNYSDAYLSDLDTSDNEEDKGISQMIKATYLAYFTSNGVSDAYSQSASHAKKSLETVLTESAKEEAQRRK